eukprot:746327-Hanusia_phi.AAC.2
MFAYGFAIEDNPADRLGARLLLLCVFATVLMENIAASRFSCVESDPGLFKKKISLLRDHIHATFPEENRILTSGSFKFKKDNISNIAILLSDEQMTVTSNHFLLFPLPLPSPAALPPPHLSPRSLLCPSSVHLSHPPACPSRCKQEDIAEVERGNPIRVYPEMIEELKSMQVSVRSLKDVHLTRLKEEKLQKLDSLTLSPLRGS